MTNLPFSLFFVILCRMPASNVSRERRWGGHNVLKIKERRLLDVLFLIYQNLGTFERVSKMKQMVDVCEVCIYRLCTVP